MLENLNPQLHYELMVYNASQTEVFAHLISTQYSEITAKLEIILSGNLLSAMDDCGCEYQILDPVTYEVIGWVTMFIQENANLKYHLVETVWNAVTNDFISTKTWPAMSPKDALSEMESECQAYLDQFPSAIASYGATSNSIIITHNDQYRILKIKETDCYENYSTALS